MAMNAPTYHFSHFHPNHPLTHYSDDQEYTCHICNTVDSGLRFRCQPCHVDIHVCCSDSPEELSSFLHSHPLAMFPPMDYRRCDFCRESIKGMFYRCDHCEFNIHPKCILMPCGSPTRTRGLSYWQAPPWTTAHQSNGYGGGYFSSGGGPANLGYPNHHVGYSYGGNYGGQRPPSRPSWGQILRAGMLGLFTNLTADTIGEFIFGSLGA
ncbi:diacylglycerol kinase theta-like [Cucumis melo var. makuwa]|uniref:Diacylglycerol kinase theta-like n=1 Tax=Cucumis melo var. makuwa TaxID=1194695 RepID=A0A5D3DJZ3_CUCMM|nr:diacylglycerol kinase theta-like [Cucumis melo var. makuwa]TYK23579.1 diacylglycerol kinase theta-like [Cucumis melo var. makuwa]